MLKRAESVAKQGKFIYNKTDYKMAKILATQPCVYRKNVVQQSAFGVRKKRENHAYKRSKVNRVRRTF